VFGVWCFACEFINLCLLIFVFICLERVVSIIFSQLMISQLNQHSKSQLKTLYIIHITLYTNITYHYALHTITHITHYTHHTLYTSHIIHITHYTHHTLYTSHIIHITLTHIIYITKLINSLTLTQYIQIPNSLLIH
jgi:hypothetical protein